jgi:hypothetical protein
MTKIPVGQVVRQAYAFAFTEIGTVIGLIWIPAAVQAAANFFILRAYYPALADAIDSGTVPGGAVALLPFLLIAISLLAFAMIGVAIARQVLGQHPGDVVAHIAFGAAELKVFGNFFLLYGLVTLFSFVLILVSGLAMALAGPGAVAVAFSVGLGALIYCGARLGVLLIPAIVDGADIGILKSWQLTGGNFWRIVGVMLATLVPLGFVVDIVTSLFMQVPPAPAAVPGTWEGMTHLFAGQLRAMQPNLPVLIGVALVLSPLTYALAFAPAAFAYRALTGKTAIEGAG